MNERAKRLNEAISKSGYSYPELEKMTGIPKSSIQRYATGETKKIPIDCIEKIAIATNADSRYLMCWEDKPVEKEGEIEKIVSEATKREDLKIFFTQVAEMPEEDFEKARKVIEAFVGSPKKNDEE